MSGPVIHKGRPTGVYLKEVNFWWKDGSAGGRTLLREVQCDPPRQGETIDLFVDGKLTCFFVTQVHHDKIKIDGGIVHHCIAVVVSPAPHRRPY